MSPACQKILSSSITGNPVILPKRLARVDLPGTATQDDHAFHGFSLL